MLMQQQAAWSSVLTKEYLSCTPTFILDWAQEPVARTAHHCTTLKENKPKSTTGEFVLRRPYVQQMARTTHRELRHSF